MMQHCQEFVAILNQPVPYDEDDDDDDDDDDECRRLLEDPVVQPLVDELAQTSYAYWFVATYAPNQLPPNAKTLAALKELRRHYVGEGRNYTKTLAAVLAAIAYRRQYRVDLLRSCFYEVDYGDNQEDAALAQRYRSLIQQDLETRQAMVARSADRYGRTIVYKGNRTAHPNNDDPDVDEAWMLTQMYTAERCIAINEFNNNNNNNNNNHGKKEEKVAVIFNFDGYSSSHSPPTSVASKLTSILQRCYPERLGTLIILDPPFWMRAFFALLRPFMSKTTTDKLQLANGKDSIDEALHDLVGHDAKLSDLLSTGNIALIDWNDYFYKPFHCPFDDERLTK